MDNTEEIEEIMEEDMPPFDPGIFRKQAAKYLYDYFYGAMSAVADKHLAESTAFAIDIENNALNHDVCHCATLYRKTPEWHNLVNDTGWAFGEIIPSYTNPETLIHRYKLRTLINTVNNAYYNGSLSLDYELICGTSGGMTALVRDLYNIFMDNVSDIGYIYEVTLREHSGYGGVISIVWKK